jgi:hypothetical protein
MEIKSKYNNSTSNFVSANSLIAKFIKYDASSVASLCVNAANSWIRHYFYTNLYGRASRGVKKSDFFFSNKTVEFLP